MNKMVAKIPQLDWVFLLLVVLISGMGILNLQSASQSAYGFNVWLNQLVWLGLGYVVVSAMFFVHYKYFREFAYTAYGMVVLLLIAVLIFGTELNGSRRWLNLGVFSFQPSELMKIAVIVFTARYFNDADREEAWGLRDILLPSLIVGGGVLTVLLEPDLGTSLVIVAIYASMLVFEKVKWTSLLIVVFAGLLALPFAWNFGLKEYQKDRVVSFLRLDDDTYGNSWQVNQSMIAFGSGKAFGKGHLLGSQIQKGFVPEHENDFVASNWGEEHGFLGMSFMFFLYFMLIFWSLRISTYAKDRFAAQIGVGFAAMVFWHVTINIGMVTGVLPVVGLPLPFMSSGGTALMTLMIGVGMVLNLSSRSQRGETVS